MVTMGIHVLENQKEYTLTATPLPIYTFGAICIGTTKTATRHNKVHIWINTEPHPVLHGRRPSRAIHVSSSVWIIISGVEEGVFQKDGSIVLAAPVPGDEGRTWSASYAQDKNVKVTVTILEATLSVAFRRFLLVDTDIPQLLSIDNRRLPMCPDIEDVIETILDKDWDQRQKEAGVIDLTGPDLHSMFESLHTRLLSLENTRLLSLENKI